MSDAEVFKIQRDSFGLSLLVYNRDRSILEIIPDREGKAAEEFGMMPLSKQYWRARIDEDGKLEAIERVDEQDW